MSTKVESLSEWMNRQVRAVQRIMDCGTDLALADLLRTVYATGYERGRMDAAAATKERATND